MFPVLSTLQYFQMLYTILLETVSGKRGQVSTCVGFLHLWKKCFQKLRNSTVNGILSAIAKNLGKKTTDRACTEIQPLSPFLPNALKMCCHWVKWDLSKELYRMKFRCRQGHYKHSYSLVSEQVILSISLDALTSSLGSIGRQSLAFICCFVSVCSHKKSIPLPW